jgi:hypothetical protein
LFTLTAHIAYQKAYSNMMSITHFARISRFVLLIGLVTQGLVSASPSLVLGHDNPWGRAVGEAIDLRSITEDMRNRANRLYPGSAAAALTHEQDELACRLREAVKNGAHPMDLRSGLAHFCGMQRRDRGLKHYAKRVDGMYGNLVRDLSRTKPILPGFGPFPSEQFFQLGSIEAPPQLPPYQPVFPEGFPAQHPGTIPGSQPPTVVFEDYFSKYEAYQGSASPTIEPPLQPAVPQDSVEF